MTPTPPRNRSGFKVAIICALPSEAENVLSVFDKYWADEGKQYGKIPGDQNTYTTGVIGKHNVVLAHMQGIGNTNAAAVASGLRTSFLGIQLALVVGICGVVPIHPTTQQDIVLGDVVVSTAVVQYDFGRHYPHEFQRKKEIEDSLGRANPEIRGFLNMLQARQNRQRLSKNLRLLLQSETFQEEVPAAQYLGADRDRLYEASYVHQHRPDVSCDKCNNNTEPCSKNCDDIGCGDKSVIVRNRHSFPKTRELALHPDDAPFIHFGRFGSANTVMKCGLLRDRLAKSDDIIAFEMEGAGVWDQYPTVVIKAACDYADSHKNKDWQGYAAAVAACCLKVFLKEWIIPDPLEDEVDLPGPILYIPFNPTPGFVGRTDELERLKSDRHRIVSILGLGGVGKSRLALELAFQVNSTRPEEWIFWIEATDQLTFEKDVLEIGKKLRIQGIEDKKADIKNLVKQRLSNSTERWLLILDNADDDTLWGRHAGTSSETRTLVHYLPRTTTGSIVITTRTPSVAAFLAGKEVIELPMMSPIESIEMFTQALREPRPVIDPAATSKLVEKLAYLPIAIIQAASYLNMTGRSVKTYLDLLDKPEEEAIQLLSEDFGDSTRYANAKNPVATTWLISLNHIRKHHAFAATIFSSMVCLNEKSIPRSLLPETKSELETINAIAVLTGYSFVSRQTGRESLTNLEEMYDLHRIVHLAGRKWLRTEERSLGDWTKTTIERVAELFPLRAQQHKSIWTTYLPHAQRLCDNHDMEDVPARYQLLEKMGLCFAVDGKYDEAVNAHALVAQWREKTLGTSDKKTLYAYSNLGEALNLKGDWAAAEGYLQRAVEGQKEFLSSDHPNTLISMTDLASTYLCQGRWKMAEELEVQILETRKRVLGNSHRSTLGSMTSLAATYYCQGRYQEAEDLGVQVMETSSKVLGLENPLTLTNIANLASTYRNQGRWKEAEQLVIPVIETSKRVLGEEHPDTLNSLANLALTYRYQGRWKEAEKLSIQVVGTMKRVFGDEHPDTLAIVANLASTYWKQARWKEAEELFSQVLKTREQLFGKNHPDTLVAGANLASTYSHQGRMAEAEALAKEVMETGMRVLREEHPDTLGGMCILASMYRNQGRNAEAEELLIKVLGIRERVLGKEHPDTLITKGNLAVTYWNQGREAEAEELEVYVMEMTRRVVGDGHPDTLTSMANLALTYRNQGRRKEARKLELEMETSKGVLRKEYPSTLARMLNLASTYWNIGRGRRPKNQADELESEGT